MKKILSASCMAVFLNLYAAGQGTFFYDQQSAIEGVGGEGAPVIQMSQPIGQSFTPTIPAVGFVRLQFYDNTQNNGVGATVVVNLRSNSITGPIISSTEPVFMPDNFGRGFPGYTNFLFSTAVPVTPGETYYFQPVVQSGDLWHVIDDSKYNYEGGMAFGQGVGDPLFDLWFREGVIVPEPGSFGLLVVGGLALLGWPRFKRDWRSRRVAKEIHPSDVRQGRL